MIAPLPTHEAERLTALRQYDLDGKPDEAYDDIVRLAALICNTPMASFSLIDRNQQRFKSTLGLDARDLPREISMCAHTILQKDLLIVPDTHEDVRFSDNPAVTGGKHIRFYAGAPVVNREGYALGVLCAVDSVPRTLTKEQKESLQTLARQTMRQMEMVRRVRTQKNTAAERNRAQEQLRQSEARLAETERTARVGIWELEVETKRLTWSAGMFRLLGFDPKQGEPSYEEARARCHPEDVVQRDSLVARSLETGEPYQYDLRLLLPSGIVRWCHVHGRPTVEADGRVMHIAGIVQDITEKMERERRLREADRTLEDQRAQLQAASEELGVLATTDALTGLLHHRAFLAQFAEHLHRAQHEGTLLAVALLDLDGFRFFNNVYGHAAGDTVLRQIAVRLRRFCGETAILARFGGDEFAALLPNADPATTPASFEAGLRAGLDDLFYHARGEAEAIPVTAAVGAATFPLPSIYGQARDVSEMLRRAEERLWRVKTGGDAETEVGRVRAHALRSLSGFSMLDALVTAVDNKDRYTRHHSEDVMDYCLMIARELRLSEAAQRTVAVSALLHDVGKIGVPDAILRKPGKLNAEEIEVVKQHPVMGAAIVQAVPGLEETLDGVLHHHERWDGNGYPFGLRGEEIPLMARIMAIADAFSAMTADRPYRKGMERSKAVSLLERGAGTQWDKRCVEAFLRALFGHQWIGIGD